MLWNRLKADTATQGEKLALQGGTRGPRLKAADVAPKTEKTSVETEKQQTRARTETDQKALDELEAAKKAVVVSMNPGVHKNYGRIRSGA